MTRPVSHIPLPWLTFVASRVLRRSASPSPGLLRLPRSLRFTRMGKLFTAVLFFIGIAAINTGNNLLYLVLASLLSLIIMSGIMSEATLKGIKVERSLPRHIYKGKAAIVGLRTENSKSTLPSFSFVVEEMCQGPFTGEPAWSLKLGAGEARLIKARYTFLRRGRHSLRGFRVSTGFPFGLFVKGREEESRCEVLVFPEVRPLKGLPPGASRATEGSARTREREGGGDLRKLRDYTLPDDSRFIHWRSAAKLDKLLVKEFEDAREKRLTVFFENRCDEGGGEGFELLVDEAASVIAHLIGEGYSVGLKTLGEEYPPAGGHGALVRLLSALATITPAAPGRGAVRLADS